MRTLIIVVFAIIALGVVASTCVSCPSIGIGGKTKYEQHGIYLNGKLLSTVSDTELGAISPNGTPDYDRRQAAWSRYSNQAQPIPREFILEIYPAPGEAFGISLSDTVVGVGMAESTGTPPTCTSMTDKIVNGEKIGRLKVIVYQPGRYYAYYHESIYSVVHIPLKR